jgi:hypothetical protein
MCCLLWRMYEMHPALSLKSGCDTRIHQRCASRPPTPYSGRRHGNRVRLCLNPRMKASEHHLSIAQLILAVLLTGDHRGWSWSLTVTHASSQGRFVPWTGDAAAQSKVMVTPHNPHHPRFVLHRVDWQTTLCSIKACGSGEPRPRSQGRLAYVSFGGKKNLVSHRIRDGGWRLDGR